MSNVRPHDIMHIHLRVDEGLEASSFEPVHAVALEGRRYRIEFTPGFVYGVAAGDEIELADDGTYEVLKRSGNVAVRILSTQSLGADEPKLTADVESSLGGRLDGNIGRGLAYTIPLTAGFAAIEEVFKRFVISAPSAVWEYGNVYADDGQPLGWWQSAA